MLHVFYFRRHCSLMCLEQMLGDITIIGNTNTLYTYIGRGPVTGVPAAPTAAVYIVDKPFSGFSIFRSQSSRAV